MDWLKGAFTNVTGEVTKAEGEKEHSKLGTLSTLPAAEKEPAQKPTSTDADSPPPGGTGHSTWLEKGADFLSQTVTNDIPNSLLNTAEKVASTGLASVHGSLDVGGDVDVNVKVGLSQETMLLLAGLSVFTAVQIYTFTR